MAQEHQAVNSVDPPTQSMRRKRGRPRKDDIHGSEPHRTQRCKVNAEGHENDPFVGQVVSGILDGKFDAGYMLTVQIGERGSVLRGVVFKPGLSVPISPANDIAPNVKMFKRDEVFPPSAWQLPSLTPIRSRKDGALRHRQRNESGVSSKEICTEAVVEDLNAEVQMHSSVNIQKLPENGSNCASGNLTQDLQCSIGDHASKGGTCNMQSTDASAECSGDIHTPEIGNPIILASDSMDTVHLQEVTSEGKSNTQQSQTVSESKQAPISDSRLGFTSDNLTVNVQEVVSDVKLDIQISQHTCEAKQTVETCDVGPVSINDNKIANLHGVDNDAKPVDEVSQIKTSESKQSAETSNASPIFMNGASDDYCKVLPLVTVQISEQITGSVADAKPVLEVSQTNTSESEQSAEASHMGPVSKNGASYNYCKTLPPVTVHILGPPTEKVVHAEPVTEVSETTTSVPKQAVETSEPGPVFKNGASDEYGKVLPPATVQASEQIIGVTESKPVTEVSQSKISESKQSSETSDVGTIFTNGASDDYVRVPPLEHITCTDGDLCEVPQTTDLSVEESAPQHSMKLALEDGTAEVAPRMNSPVGQESQVRDKPVELSSELLMDNPLPTKVIPEQLQNDQASPRGGASNEVYSTATTGITNGNFQGADVDGDSWNL